MRLAAIAVLAAACGGSTAAVHPRFDPSVIGTDDFWGLPYPTDLRRTATGIDFTGFPNPGHSSTLAAYTKALGASQSGFGQASALYVSFDGAIDPATLTSASVKVVDVASGDSIPLQISWRADASLFLPANTLALLPYFGTPLLGGHQYALVVTREVKDLHGTPVQPTSAMQQALPAQFKDAALASVFTVQEPMVTLQKLRDAARATDAPTAQNQSCADQGGSYVLCTGTFPDPNFQTGKPPYSATGGNFAFDASGAPVVQRTEQVRFAFTTPEGSGPFPTVLYEHGTGGDYESFVREGIGADLAARGVATLSMDQVLHGPRNPACDESSPSYEACTGESYFNFLNPYAGRDNTRQGAADGFQLVRLAHSIPQLDATKLAFFGHSQGGLTGSPFIAAEPELQAAVTSGTGGILAITILVRKDPLDFKSLTESLAGIAGKESLEPFHPILMLIQTFAEPADPISYGRFFAGGKSVVMLEGMLDPYVAPDASEALGAAAGFDIGGAAVHQSAAFQFLGLHVDPLPRALPKGSGLLLQFPDDDHFAFFDNPIARCQVEGFLLGSLAGNPAVAACN